MHIPVLMYHQLDGNDRYSVSEYDFSRQMHLLFRKGYRTLLPGELSTADAHAGKPVMITFDDGFASDWHIAFPLMRKYGFRGVSFVTTGFIGKPGYLDWQQIRAIAAGGFSLQSHTHTHTLLATMGEEDVRRELRHSRELLERGTGRAVSSLAMPGGSGGADLARLAGEEGYRFLFTSEPRMNTRAGSAEWGRVLITANTSLAMFQKIIEGDRSTYRQALRSYRLRKAVKKLIGPATYHRFWRRYIKYRAGGAG